jgi:hypothetical protein
MSYDPKESTILTVEKLIEQLQEFPPDTAVAVRFRDPDAPAVIIEESACRLESVSSLSVGTQAVVDSFSVVDDPYSEEN